MLKDVWRKGRQWLDPKAPAKFCQWPDVDMKPIGAPIRFRVTKPAVVTWKGKCYRTPLDGMLTDFASVPPALRPLVGQVGRHASSAIVHDAAYQCELEVKVKNGADELGNIMWQWKPARPSLTREEADQMFHDLMQASGSIWWRRKGIHRAVRWFGKKHWQDCN